MELLEAEYQLFKWAVYNSVAMTTTTSRDAAPANESRRRLLEQFIGLQQRHAALVASLLRSHALLQQVSMSVCLSVTLTTTSTPV